MQALSCQWSGGPASERLHRHGPGPACVSWLERGGRSSRRHILRPPPTRPTPHDPVAEAVSPHTAASAAARTVQQHQPPQGPIRCDVLQVSADAARPVRAARSASMVVTVRAHDSSRKRYCHYCSTQRSPGSRFQHCTMRTVHATPFASCRPYVTLFGDAKPWTSVRCHDAITRSRRIICRPSSQDGCRV
jgi:hypothetical protein